MTADTIAAVATPPGAGGVGVIRVSGPRALDIVARLVGRDVESLPDRRLIHAGARDPSGDKLDAVLVVAMRAPRSYTGENIGEIHGHGGALNMGRLLRAVLALGARAAEPGEFTRRAFLNGRIDLTGAEAVMDLIHAASERALRAAHAGLAGGLRARVAELQAAATALHAEVEASIDFPEEDLDFLPADVVAARADALADGARSLARTYTVGRALRHGLEVALVGAPNVGKSSLLNALVEEERALVAADPGTTRDWVEARVVWEGVPVTVIDTAGEREAEQEVERRGVVLGRERAERADVVVRVRDASGCGPSPAVASPAVAGVGGSLSCAPNKREDNREIEVWNKTDLAPPPANALGVSAKNGQGLEALKRVILTRVLGEAADGDEQVVVATERQRRLLDEAAEAAARAAAVARAGRPAELVAADVGEVAARLGAITGQNVGEDMLDALFARFCLGK